MKGGMGNLRTKQGQNLLRFLSRIKDGRLPRQFRHFTTLSRADCMGFRERNNVTNLCSTVFVCISGMVDRALQNPYYGPHSVDPKLPNWK
ncbi:hypothetical protein SAMN02910456_00632 [Ruminococcaceae bacterium YRB3002]|nr:hypothetical protein SAMN02910456_00632 [Ruminococcaceae bacterium YRB3002]